MLLVLVQPNWFVAIKVAVYIPGFTYVCVGADSEEQRPDGTCHCTTVARRLVESAASAKNLAQAALPAHRYTWLRLKLETCSQLEIAIVLGSDDRAATDDINPVFRQVEVGMIRKVERFRADLKRDALAECDAS